MLRAGYASPAYPAGYASPAYPAYAPSAAAYAAPQVQRPTRLIKRKEVQETEYEVKQRTIEVPEIVGYREHITTKPKITQQEVVVGSEMVPQILELEKTIEVPTIVPRERCVEVPQVVGVRQEIKQVDKVIQNEIVKNQVVPQICVYEREVEQPVLEIRQKVEEIPCFTQWYEETKVVPKIIENEIPVHTPVLCQQTVEIQNEYVTTEVQQKDVEVPQVYIRNATKTEIKEIPQEIIRRVPVPAVQTVEIPVDELRFEYQQKVVPVPQIKIQEVQKTVPKVIPQVTEYNINIPQIQTIEKIVEIPVPQPIEKIEYVPEVQIEVVERKVDKVVVEYVEKEVPVPQVQTIEKHIEIPQIQYVEKVEYVPEIQIETIERQVPKVVVEYVEKEVIVPQIQEIIKEVIIPQTQYVERTVVDVNVQAIETLEEVQEVVEIERVSKVKAVEEKVRAPTLSRSTSYLPPEVTEEAGEIIATRPAQQVVVAPQIIQPAVGSVITPPTFAQQRIATAAYGVGPVTTSRPVYPSTVV